MLIFVPPWVENLILDVFFFIATVVSVLSMQIPYCVKYVVLKKYQYFWQPQRKCNLFSLDRYNSRLGTRK